MHFSFWEKIGFAALMTAWVVWGSAQIGELLVHAEPLEEPAYEVAGVEQEGGGEAQAKPEGPDTMTLLASIDPSKGESVFNKCKACHTIEKGGANKVGPNLHNVVGNKIANNSDFSYSDAVGGMDGEWTYEKLSDFLENPRGFASGTKMTFAGLSKAEDRAAVIAYLRENTENPPPLPEPKEQPKQAEAEGGEQAKAEGGEQAAADVQGGDLASALQGGSADDGKKVFNKCKACHTVEQGGPNRVGPNLYGVVGSKVASSEGFNYSGALKDLGGEWTYEKLNDFLEKPREFASGTKMTFAGLKDMEDRANVILYLRENSENPPPLP